MHHVQASLLPFHLHRQTLQVPEGLTLQGMVDFLFPHKVRGVEIVVNIGDQVIPRSKWVSVKPKSHTLVGINAIPAGGKGKKNPLSAILSIALIVAAPYITAALAGPLAAGIAGTIGPYTAGQFALASGIIRIGISLVGFLATSMLSSVPKQKNAGVNTTEPSAQFIEGASNRIPRYEPVPVNLGTNRVFPPQGALPYTETSGNNQYARQLFNYGFGKVLVSDRKIGETAISEYDGIEMNDRLNADLIDGVGLYSNDIFQDGYSVLLSNATGYVTRTTQRDSDEVELDVTFTGGLTEYSNSGQRSRRAVSFDVAFAPTGTSNWSTGAANVSIGSQTVAVPFPSALNKGLGVRFQNGMLVLNLNTGVVIAMNSGDPIPDKNIRIASYRTQSNSPSSQAEGGVATVVSLIDDRGSHIPGSIVSGFTQSYGGSGLNISIAAGVIAAQPWEVADSTAQALRVVRRLVFPSRGQYDIRIRRLTDDSVNDRIRDAATLTAIRSIRHTNPINQTDISGTAMRLLATDQLNGTVNSYNCILSTLIKDYDANLDIWVSDVASSNCASIFRYVLQTQAFVKRLPDARINLEKLEEWHNYCRINNLTYDRFVDQKISVDDLLSDIAAAGMATLHKVNGVYSVLIDDERPTIKGMVTPRNSWGYSGSITYPDLPHALRVQFRNANAGYATDERIVYSDGYDESNATLFERLEFDSCTNADLAWFYGRRYLASAILQPEIHTFNMDFENLTFNRGDKIIFVNDTILVGVGQGRILELIYDDPDTPTECIGFRIDDVVTIPSAEQFGVRIRYGDGSGFVYHSLTTVIGPNDEFTFATPIPYGDEPPLDSLCAFTEFGKELELLVTEITMNKDHSGRITAVNYAPERFNATTGTIPPFESNITLSLDFYRPYAPQLGGEIQSDEAVMIRNSDGSYTGRMIIPLINRNEPSIAVVIRARPTGATQWFRPDILSSSPETVVITGLEDGSSYDFRIAYQRTGGRELLSQNLELNGVVYRGASAAPSAVSDFEVSVSDNTGLFRWTPNTEIDISHYEMRFTRLTTGALWETAQLLADNITGNRISLPIQAGTYLIKAVDILGNYSATATTIVSIDNGAFNNVIALLTQQTSWVGVKDNTHVIDDELYLIDPTEIGYYYFDPDPFDLSEIYKSTLSSSILAEGSFYSRVRSWGATRSEAFARGGGSTLIRSVSSIRSLDSVRGIDPSDWSVTLEIQISDDDITYSDWAAFTVGDKIFRFARFRLVLRSFNNLISPRVSVAEVLIDMPDRQESGENVACPPSGAIVTYDVAFRNNPAVNITLQNGATDDRLDYVYKTEAGFHVRVYNDTAADYVTRSFDYISSGYGRVVV